MQRLLYYLGLLAVLPLLAPVSVQAAPKKGDKKDGYKPTVAVLRLRSAVSETP